MRYAIVIEKAEGNYSAYVPICRDALQPALAEAEKLIREAIEFHLSGLREDHTPFRSLPAESITSTLQPNNRLLSDACAPALLRRASFSAPKPER